MIVINDYYDHTEWKRRNLAVLEEHGANKRSDGILLSPRGGGHDNDTMRPQQNAYKQPKEMKDTEKHHALNKKRKTMKNETKEKEEKTVEEENYYHVLKLFTMKTMKRLISTDHSTSYAPYTLPEYVKVNLFNVKRGRQRPKTRHTVVSPTSVAPGVAFRYLLGILRYLFPKGDSRLSYVFLA